MKARRNPLSRLLVVPALLAALGGCDAREYKIPANQPATPVVPIPIAIDLSSDKTALSLDAEKPRATLKVVAYRADTWEALPDGTNIAFSTNLGNFESLAGPQEVDIDLIGGEVTTFFYPGEEEGIARIRATVRGSFDTVNIEIKNPPG